MDLEAQVRAEIEALHAFFVGWFGGSLPESALEPQFIRRLASDFLLIPPAGITVDLEGITSSVRQGYATNPEFRVAIRRVVVRREWDDLVLATYEEWQRNALASTPVDNGRVASVLFRRGDPLQWLHIHETWLPEPVMTAGPYDF